MYASVWDIHKHVNWGEASNPGDINGVNRALDILDSVGFILAHDDKDNRRFFLATVQVPSESPSAYRIQEDDLQTLKVARAALEYNI